MRKLLLIAVALRLLVSGLLFHPDIKTIAFQTSFLKKGIVNIYPYLINNKVSLPLKEEFVYFPLSYLTLGSYQTVISSFLGNDFSNWLSDAGANSVVNNPNIIKYLIFLKFPLLVCDILIAFLLLNFFKNRKKGEQAFTLWLFNPFTIILIYAFSNIDIYVVLLTVIAFLYIKREKLITASVFLGLAISFKLYPLLFVPFLFLKTKNIKDKILTVLIPISIFVISIIPFWSEAFVKSALVSGLSVRIFSPNFEIGFGESMIIGIFLLSILFCFAWMYEKNIKLLNYFIVLLLVLFSFSHFHISWLLWIAPFLVIVVIKKPITLWPVLLWSMLAISIPLFYTDRSMTISLFRIYTTWFDLLPTPFIIMQKLYDPYNFQSVLHSALAGVSVVLSYTIFKKEAQYEK
ncbi:MAG: glycosyltransferase 87 family protein [Patescibacteria group bacterium]